MCLEPLFWLYSTWKMGGNVYFLCCMFARHAHFLPRKNSSTRLELLFWISSTWKMDRNVYILYCIFARYVQFWRRVNSIMCVAPLLWHLQFGIWGKIGTFHIVYLQVILAFGEEWIQTSAWSFCFGYLPLKKWIEICTVYIAYLPFMFISVEKWIQSYAYLGHLRFGIWGGGYVPHAVY